MEESKDMQLEYQNYYRAPGNSSFHTLEYLSESIQLSIQRDLEEQSRESKARWVAQMVKGNVPHDLKLASEDKANKDAQRERSAAAAIAKQLGEAMHGTALPVQEQQQQQQPGAGKKHKKKKGDEVVPPTAAPAGDETKPSKPKFFLAENGEKLQWLTDPEFARVQKCCYDFAKGMHVGTQISAIELKY